MRTKHILLAGLLAGCATAPPAPPSTAEPGIVRLNVPLFPDRSNQCGPAALAGILKFWGKDVSMAALKQEIYRSSLKGTLSIDLLLAAQAHGMSAKILDGDLGQIKKELDAGHPVLAFLNQGFSFLPVGHYLVVTGYDERRHGVYVNSDVRTNAFMPDETFKKEWQRTDQWALLILPAAG